jgi:hypothetical protein
MSLLMVPQTRPEQAVSVYSSGAKVTYWFHAPFVTMGPYTEPRGHDGEEGWWERQTQVITTVREHLP